MSTSITDLPEIDGGMFLCKSTVVYGNTGTGKSTLMIDIMYKLRGQIKVAMVFNKNDGINGTFSSVLPSCLVHKEFNANTLASFYESCKNYANLYNDMSANIDRLTDKYLPGEAQDRLNRDLERIERLRDEHSDDERAVSDERVLYYKEIVKQKFLHKYGENMRGTEDHRFIRYMNKMGFGPPYSMIVIDDFSEKLDEINKLEIFNVLLTECRHCYVTFIMCAHNIQYVDKKRRSMFGNSVMTDNVSANKFPNYCDAPTKQTAQSVRKQCSNMFGRGDHRKLMYKLDNDRAYILHPQQHDKGSFRLLDPHMDDAFEKLV